MIFGVAQIRAHRLGPHFKLVGFRRKIQMKTTQHQHQHSHLASTETDTMITNEIRCWACWETDDTHSNPLIRACLKCKDEELQYIHQTCIDTYMSNIIQARFPGGWQSFNSCDNIPYLSRETMQSLTSKYADKTGSIESSKAFNHNDHIESESLLSTTTCTRNGWTSLAFMDMHCTRCMDEYDVMAKPVNPLRVLAFDRVMRVLMALMTICIIVLCTSCILLIVNANDFVRQCLVAGQSQLDAEKELLISTWVLPQPMDVRNWAMLMSVTFTGSYLITLFVVLCHSSGYSEITVNGKETRKQRGASNI